MAALCFFTSDTFEIGDLVCVDVDGSAVAYDNSKPVVGVCLLPESGCIPNGRQYFAINGAPYYENDFYVWKEDLTSDFVAENSSFSPFNPIGDSGYVTAITHGFAAVKKTAVGIPTGWIKLQEKVDFDWYRL